MKTKFKTKRLLAAACLTLLMSTMCANADPVATLPTAPEFHPEGATNAFYNTNGTTGTVTAQTGVGGYNQIRWDSLSVGSGQNLIFNSIFDNQTILNYVKPNGPASVFNGGVQVTGNAGTNLLIINPNGIISNGASFVSTAANSNLFLSTHKFDGSASVNESDLDAYSKIKFFGWIPELTANGIVINDSAISGFDRVTTLSQGIRITGSTISADNSFTSLIAGDAIYDFDNDTFSDVHRTEVAPINVHYSDVLQPDQLTGFYNTDDQFLLDKTSKVQILSGHNINIQLLSKALFIDDCAKPRDVSINLSGQLIADNCISSDGQIFIYAEGSGSVDPCDPCYIPTPPPNSAVKPPVEAAGLVQNTGYCKDKNIPFLGSKGTINLNNPLVDPADPTGPTLPVILTHNQTPNPFNVVQLEADKITVLNKNAIDSLPRPCDAVPPNPAECPPVAGLATIQLANNTNTQASITTRDQCQQTLPIGVDPTELTNKGDEGIYSAFGTLDPKVTPAFDPEVTVRLCKHCEAPADLMSIQPKCNECHDVTIQWETCTTPPPPPPGGGGGVPPVAIAAPVGLAALATPFLFPPPIFGAAPITGAAAPVMCPDMQAIPVYDEAGNIKYLRIVKKA